MSDDTGRAGDRTSIRPCADADLGAMEAIINAAACAYGGVIPADRYHQPYMPLDELCDEIAAGVRFWGLYERDNRPAAVGDDRLVAPTPVDRAAASPVDRVAAAPVDRAAAAPADRLAGVMGIQDVDDVTLIRHAYVRPERQRGGVGGRLLKHLMEMAAAAVPPRPLLVGTWAAAWWAVAFYERHGFVLVTPEEKDRLLRRYWTISERQVETSVVLRLTGSRAASEVVEIQPLSG